MRNLLLTRNVAQYEATQTKQKINEVQKGIGKLMKAAKTDPKAKEEADALLKQKTDLEKAHKTFVESAAEKQVALTVKLNTIGNYVHDSVRIGNNEVRGMPYPSK